VPHIVQKRACSPHDSLAVQDGARPGARERLIQGAQGFDAQSHRLSPEGMRHHAEQGVSGGGGTLPHHDRIQAAFGRHSIADVRYHDGAPAAAASRAIGANAYAIGPDIASARPLDLHTAAHEAAHTVQQQQGVQLYGGVGAAGDVYEQHADAVADKVVAGESAEGLLDQMPTSGGGPVTAVQGDWDWDKANDWGTNILFGPAGALALEGASHLPVVGGVAEDLQEASSIDGWEVGLDTPDATYKTKLDEDGMPANVDIERKLFEVKKSANAGPFYASVALAVKAAGQGSTNDAENVSLSVSGDASGMLGKSSDGGSVGIGVAGSLSSSLKAHIDINKETGVGKGALSGDLTFKIGWKAEAGPLNAGKTLGDYKLGTLNAGSITLDTRGGSLEAQGDPTFEWNQAELQRLADDAETWMMITSPMGYLVTEAVLPDAEEEVQAPEELAPPEIKHGQFKEMTVPVKEYAKIPQTDYMPQLKAAKSAASMAAGKCNGMHAKGKQDQINAQAKQLWSVGFAALSKGSALMSQYQQNPAAGALAEQALAAFGEAQQAFEQGDAAQA